MYKGTRPLLQELGVESHTTPECMQECTAAWNIPKAIEQGPSGDEGMEAAWRCSRGF